jgi:hypothetical protein
MVNVVVTDEFKGWYDDLDETDAGRVAFVVDLLEAAGVSLGFPHSSAIEGSRIAMRELRVQSKGRPIRVLYAFDPARDAVLIIGGDKTGNDRFYEEYVPKAEAIWAEYLRELGAGK